MKSLDEGLSAVAALVVAVMSLGSAGCGSIPPLSGGKDDGPPQIRLVSAGKAPFYNYKPGKSSVPFIYLTEGTAVEWLADKGENTKVKLPNGSTGWVPTGSLGEPMVGWPAAAGTPEEGGTAEERREERSRATHVAHGDESLHPFNRTDGVW